MTLPPIDETTVIKKPYGQIGVALNPAGGITRTPELGISPILASGDVRGIPDVFIGATQVDPSTVRIYATALKQGELVFVQVLMEITTDGFKDVDGNQLTGILTMQLPYEMSAFEYVGALAWIYPFAQPGYPRYVQRNSSTTVKFVTNQDVAMTDSSPATWGPGNVLLSFDLSYFVDVDAPLLWESVA